MILSTGENNLRFKKLIPGHAEDVLIWGLSTIAFFILFAKLNHIIEYVFIGLLAIWVCVRLTHRNFHLVRTPLDLPIALFITWILITIPFAASPSYSFAEWRKTIIQMVMFFFVVNVVNNERQVRQILQAFVAGLVFLAVIGVFEHLISGKSLLDKNSHASSLTSAGQWFSTYIVMGMPVVWFFWGENQSRHAKVFLSISLVLLLTALFLSHTRGAWLALLIQILLAILINMKLKWLKWTLTCVTLGLLILIGQWFMNAESQVIIDIPFSSIESMNIRLDTWQIALKQIAENPVMGYGYGFDTFPMVNPTIQVGPGDTPSIDMHLHNVFLSKAYELGLIGLTFFLLILGMIGKIAYEGFQQNSHIFFGKLALCVFLVLIGVVTRNMFDNMFAGTLVYLFWLLTGLYFALRSQSHKGERGFASG